MQLSESAPEYELLFVQSLTPTLVFERETSRIVVANEATCRLYGCAASELASVIGLEITEDGPAHRAARHRKKDGTPLEVEMSFRPVTFREKASLLVMVNDVTAARAPEEQMLQRFFAVSPDLCAISTRDGLFLRLSPAWEQTLGWSQGELLGRFYLDFVHTEDREATRARHDNARFEGMFENRYLCKDGSYRCLQWVSRVAGDLVIAVARDVTGVRESEERYRALFDASPHPKFVFDVDTLEMLEVNKAALQSYGYGRTEFLRLTLRDLVVPEAAARHKRKDGSTFDVDTSSHAVSFGGRPACISVCVDVSERKLLEQQLVQALKMEAIGTLAGGVAHDFNNILAVIFANTDLILEQLPPDSPLRVDVDDILTVAKRGASLTRQLLAFSRHQTLQPRPISVNAIVTDFDKMVRRLIGEDIDVRLDLSDGLGSVIADPGQIEQVLLNLAVNARDAMRAGGVLTIFTKSVDVSGADARTVGDLAPGDYVAIGVSDTGTGIPPEVLPKIFEPFFTTKQKGKGTGLGLSTVFGIVKQSGGAVIVDSKPGATTFRVLLRCAEGLDFHSSAPAAPSDMGGSEHVLVVEDEAPVRASLARILESRGYTVLEAKDGREALRVCATEPKIDLLLTDVVMPGEDGVSVATRVRDRVPGIRVLYMSGYTDHAALVAGPLDPTQNLLHKPFTAVELVSRVRAALDEKA